MKITPNHALRVLMLEDSAVDAAMVERDLRAGGIKFLWKCVETESEFRMALSEFQPTLILLDNQLPGFDGTAGLVIAQQVCPDVPLIFVSGTVGEERATELLKLGATDYVLKDNRTRLVPAVERALRDVKTRAERRREEEALLLRDQALQASSNGIVIADMRQAEMPIVFVNPAFERITGYAEHETLNRNCRFLQGDDTDQPQIPLVRAALEAGKPLTVTLRNYRKDGTLFWNELYLAPIRDAEGELTHFVGIQNDVTERKQSEDALRESEASLRRAHSELETRVQERTAELLRAKEEAEEANQAKSEFLSRMSHELRTPLNAILGFGQILDKQNLTPLQEESVQYILKGGRHLLQLINEVLDIARVEAGHIELSLEAVALTEVVSEACTLVSPLLAERGIALNIDAATLDSRHVLADRQRFKQALLNLLSNAIKYNRPQGHVRVYACLAPDNRVRIAVEDTGPGISHADHPRLFTPFERLNASSEVEGSGLGLVLSQRLVTAMGGRISLESTPGQGSAFFIELPSVSSPEETLTEQPIGAWEPKRASRAEHRATVLSIEDNLSNLRLIEIVLRSRPGITLVPAMQGSIGLDLARQHKPDLILLDLNLPDISGREVLARLQASAPTRDIPVIVLSADATDSQIERLLVAGAKAYLTKPLDVTEFLQTLDTMLLHKKTGDLAGGERIS